MVYDQGMPRLARIVIYPIKALDGVVVPSARIRPAGGLEGDRELAIVDAGGRMVNGKRDDRVHRLRAAYDLGARTVTLRPEGAAGSQTFHLDRERDRLAAWLSDYFGAAVHLRHDAERGFPDDHTYWGPTLVSTATLDTVASWFPTLDRDNVRARFRPNLEVEDTEPFWEDGLLTDGPPRIFTVGPVRLEAVAPWPRCAVPSRDPHTGEPIPFFQQVFAARRAAALPAWAPRARFDHTYRLCVGTRVPASEVGKVLRVGDAIRPAG